MWQHFSGEKQKNVAIVEASVYLNDRNNKRSIYYYQWEGGKNLKFIESKQSFSMRFMLGCWFSQQPIKNKRSED